VLSKRVGRPDRPVRPRAEAHRPPEERGEDAAIQRPAVSFRPLVHSLLPPAFSAHSKRQVEHEWKLPAALMTYEQPLDFDLEDEAENAPLASTSHPPLTVGDFLLHNGEQTKRSSLSEDFDFVELLENGL
jgi:hypothetical protein